MTKRKLIGFGLIMSALAVISAYVLFAPSRPQVIGRLAPDDLTVVLRLVREDLRRYAPRAEWDDFRKPGPLIRCARDYQAQRILWVQAHDDGKVEAFAGVSRAAIRDEGYYWQLRRDAKWMITGGAHWENSNCVPAEVQVSVSP